MNKIVLNDKDYVIREVSIDDYDYYHNKEKVDEMELIARMTNCPMEELTQVPFTQVRFVAQYIQTLMNDEKPSPLHLTIELGGVKYGLFKPASITYAEWINLEVFMTESPLNIRRLATHFYRPLASDKLGEERELIPYNMEECMAREKEFGKLPIKWFLSALFFFNQFVQEYTKIILSSMETKLTEEGKKNEIIKNKLKTQTKSNNP